MRFLPLPSRLVAATFCALFSFGCTVDASLAEPAASESAITFASPGQDLGAAVDVFADTTAGDAVFTNTGRSLERHDLSGRVDVLGETDAGFQSFAVSKNLAAYFIASPDWRSKGRVFILERASGWRQIRSEDASPPQVTGFRQPIVTIDDDTFAVGVGDRVIVLRPDGSRATFGEGFQKDVFSIHPVDSSHFYAMLVDGSVFDVDARTGALTLQPPREAMDPRPGELLFDRRTATWVSADFEGIKVHSTSGKLLRKANLESPHGYFIQSAAIAPDGRLLVTYPAESMPGGSVLAAYDLDSLTRSELGTFSGQMMQLRPTHGRLFFLFSGNAHGLSL